MASEIAAGTSFYLFIMLVPATLLLMLYSWMLLELYDLQNDFINPFDCCNALNYWTQPETYAHPVLLVMYMLTGPDWTLALGHLAFTAYNMYLNQNKNLSYDPAKMLDSKYVKNRQKIVMKKVAFQVVLMLLLVYKLLWQGLYQLMKTPLHLMVSLRAWLP